MSAALELQRHAATPCAAARRVSVELQRTASQRLQLRYQIDGDIQALKVPVAVPSQRADHLWQHTCCELFLADREAAGYCEHNFSPSRCWAAYRFSAYRMGMRELAMEQSPEISCSQDASSLVLTAELSPDGWSPAAPAPLRLALSVVIEGSDGGLSYWALRHAPGRADFHHAAGFIELEL